MPPTGVEDRTSHAPDGDVGEAAKATRRDGFIARRGSHRLVAQQAFQRRRLKRLGELPDLLQGDEAHFHKG